jgi:trypsin
MTKSNIIRFSRLAGLVISASLLGACAFPEDLDDALEMDAEAEVEDMDEEVAEAEQEIVGGTPVLSDTKYPWMASLRKYGSHSCGAAIYNARTLITAAHCVGGSPGNYSIRVGSLTHALGGWVYNIANVKPHPSYNPSTDDNDIAVIITSQPIMFNTTVKPIGLAPAGSDPAGGTMSTAIGWGVTSVQGLLSPSLLEVDVPIVARSTCQSAYGPGWVSTNMICAAAPGKDACQGDSGGPLMIKGPDGVYQLHGLTSWGVGCAFPNYPGVYTRVSNYIAWIAANAI